VTYIDATVSGKVTRRLSLCDDSRFMSMEKESDPREREEMSVLTTIKYSRNLFVVTKSEPAARKPAERGAR